MIENFTLSDDFNFYLSNVQRYNAYENKATAINRIIQLRKSKGGWKSFEEIVSDNIFTEEQALSLEPYLHFGTTPIEFRE